LLVKTRLWDDGRGRGEGWGSWSHCNFDSSPCSRGHATTIHVC